MKAEPGPAVGLPTALARLLQPLSSSLAVGSIKRNQDDKKKKDFEPFWLDPSNDRKTPYTEEELDLFVKGFIDSNRNVWIEVHELGEEQAWNRIKDGFRKMDERHISNIESDNSPIHC